MTYRVTFRKYRPQSLSDVLGQGHVVISLRNAIERKKIPQAYLFSGIRGIGKTSVARILSKSLNCFSGMTLQPCGKCISCKEITESISSNVLEIDGASSRGIEEIKRIKENSQYLPNQNCLYKIYIIDEVHMLTDQAFNALLKILEEPPSYVVFIFATTESSKVKLTIRSRCQHYFFRPITRKVIEKHICDIASKEGIQIDSQTLFSIAIKSFGSMRDAQNLFDQVYIYSDKKDIRFKEVSEILGFLSTEFVCNFLESLFKNDIKNLLVMIDKCFKQGEDIYQFIWMLIQAFKQILLIKQLNLNDDQLALFDLSFLDINTDTSENSLLIKYKDYFSTEFILEILDLLFKLYNDLSKNFDPYFLLEGFIFKILKMKSFYKIDFLLEKVKVLENVLLKNIKENRIEVKRKVLFDPKFDLSKFLMNLKKEDVDLYKVVVKVIGIKFSNVTIMFFFNQSEYLKLIDNQKFLLLIQNFLKIKMKVKIKEYIPKNL